MHMNRTPYESRRQPGSKFNRAVAGAKLAGLPESLIRDVLALDEAPNRGHRLLEHLPLYLSASEALWAFVDGWQPPS